MNRAPRTPAAPQATSASTTPAQALPSQPEEVEPFTLELELLDDDHAALCAELQAAADLAAPRPQTEA